jgi:hypothetical protein
MSVPHENSFRAMVKRLADVRVNGTRKSKYSGLVSDLKDPIPSGACRFVVFNTSDPRLQRNIKQGIDTKVHGAYPGRFSIRMGYEGVIITERIHG